MKHLIPFTKDQLQIVQASLQLSLKYADSQYVDNVDEIMQIIEEYHESQFDEEPKTLMDIPKDWEGSSISIGDCLLDLQNDINELHDYFSSQEEV